MKTIKREELKLGSLFIPPEYQRPFDAEHPAVVDGYNEMLFGTPVISRRPNGTNAVVDGQHSISSAMEALGPDYVVWCKVHYGLTVAEESMLFHLLQKKRKGMSAMASYNSLLVAGDIKSVEIANILRGNGFSLSNVRTKTGAVQAIRAIERIHKKNANLVTVLRLARAWATTDAKAMDGSTLSALSAFLKKYPRVDLDIFSSKLKSITALEAQVGMKALAGSISKTKAAELYFLNVYNKGLRTGRLDPELV